MSHIDRPGSLILRAAERDHVENPQNSSVIFRDYEYNNARVNLRSDLKTNPPKTTNSHLTILEIPGLPSTLLSNKY